MRTWEAADNIIHPCQTPQAETQNTKNHTIASDVSDTSPPRCALAAATIGQNHEHEHDEEKRKELEVCHNFMSLIVLRALEVA